MTGGIFIKNSFMMIIAYVAMVTTNVLSNTLPINGQTTAEISDKLTVLFTPAGYVFSIWGIIYVLLAIWLFLQVKNRHTEQATSNTVSYLFVASCVFNIIWLLTWHYEYFALSIIVMLLLLITLIAIYKQYRIADSRFGGRFPFSFYLGWISVATIANMSYTLKYYAISLGIDEVTGTIILIIIAGILAIAGRYLSNDPYFSIVFVWAIVGIAARNTEQSIVITAYVVAAIIFIAILVVSFMRKPTIQTA